MKPKSLSSSLASARLIVFGLLVSLVASQSPVQAAEPAKPWQWEKTRTSMALVINGIWWEYFKLGSALDTVGIRQQEDFENLSQYSVIVMVNASPNRIPGGGQEKIREFVQQGGGLVVLGGLSAYSNSGYHNQPILVDMLPVDLKDSYIEFFPVAEKGAKLVRADQADWPLKFDFAAGPAAYYFHTLIPKKDAKVQVKVGDQPAFVTSTLGKGRVVACSLTVNGNPPSGSLPFWDWKDWPVLLGQACEWAAGARPVGVETVKKTAATEPKPLTEDEIRSAELALDALPKGFVNRAVAHPDEKTAKLLFDLAVTENEEPKCALNVVLPAVLPYARPEWGPRLKTMAEPNNPNIETRQAALILLGACREASAYGALMRALGDPRTQLAALEGLGWLGNTQAIPQMKSKFEEALKTAETTYGRGRWKPGPFADASQPAAYAAIAMYRLGDPEGVVRLCTLAADINLYQRIICNATKRQVREGDAQGIAILQSLIASCKTISKARDYIAANTGPVPASQRAAFVQYAASTQDPVMIEFVVAALEKSVNKTNKAEWQPLASAKSGIIAKVTKALSE